MNDYGNTIENFYIIRVSGDETSLKLDELESILESDERAKLERIIKPISAAIAFLYDSKLVEELEERGYELLPQRLTRMIEGES